MTPQRSHHQLRVDEPAYREHSEAWESLRRVQAVAELDAELALEQLLDRELTRRRAVELDGTWR